MTGKDLDPGAPRPMVVKFGGAALRYPEWIAAAVRRRSSLAPLAIVASARQGVTDLLEKAAREPSVRTAGGLERELRRRHSGSTPALCRELDRTAELLRHVPSRTIERQGWREELRSVGERLAIRWLAEELAARGVRSRSLDTDRIGLLVVGPPGRGRIDVTASRRKVGRAVAAAWQAGSIPILTGYFGLSQARLTSTLGRNGSDYSATALGELLSASQVELVKPAIALRTARALLGGRMLGLAQLRYSDAERLARSGSGILHPRSVAPVRRAGIPLGLVRLQGSHSRGLWFGGAQRGGPVAREWFVGEMLPSGPRADGSTLPVGDLAT